MADTKSPEFKEHVRALQTLYSDVSKHATDEWKGTLLFLFSGMDDFGGEYQEVEFRLKRIDYDKDSMSYYANPQEVFPIYWVNDTEAEQKYTLKRSETETQEKTFTFVEGFKVGASTTTSTHAEVELAVPVVKFASGKASLDFSVTYMAEFSFQAQQSIKDTKTRSIEVATEINVPARARLTGAVTQSRGSCTGKYEAVFEAAFTDYGLSKYGKTLAELVPGGKLELKTTGHMSGMDTIDTRVVTKQEPLEASVVEAA